MRVAALVALAIVAVAAGALFLWLQEDQGGELPFDSARWTAASRREDAEVRGRMVEDLVQSGRLLGLSREQLQDLLGPPDRSGPTTAIYYLGREPGIPIDSFWLLVHLTLDGRVVNAWTSRD